MKFNTLASTSHTRRLARARRGIALLLVMIGMVVCTILTAGFLSTQGTSIGIARNERDAEKCRVLAQTGIDLCYWQIRNKSDWRETMPVGTWLNNQPVGDGTVTVTVANGIATTSSSGGSGGGSSGHGNGNGNGNGTGSFADDPTQGVTLTSTGTYDNRSFTLVATIQPTGGGTVFYNGNFVNGTITLGNTLLLGAATIDSYNSNNSPYNAGTPGSNAAFSSSSLANNSLLVYFPSIFRGSYTAAPTALLSNILGLIGLGVSGPTSTSTAAETRIPGIVVPPNVAGLTYRGALNVNTGVNNPFAGPGRYDSASASNVPININANGFYYITGNLSISNAAASLVVADGVSAVVMVDGNVTVNGKINLVGTAQLALYCNSPVTVNGTTASINTNGATNRFTLYGGIGCSKIQILNNSTVVGSVYAPQADFIMKTSSPKFYGAVVANSLTVINTAQLHFDEALRSLYISNIIGGSAPPGTADYRLTMTGGPGLGN